MFVVRLLATGIARPILDAFTVLRVWVCIHTHFFLTFLKLDQTQSIPVRSDYLVARMKAKTESYNR